MEILNNFGFEPVFFIAQIVNFLILFVLFKKFLLKPILKILKDRSREIAQGISDAENARKSLEDAEQQKDKIITKAALEAEKIIKETKDNAQDLREEILTKSREDADKIILEAREAAQLELVAIQNQARDISLNLTKKVLDKVLSDFFTKEEKGKIFDRNIKRIGKYE